MTMMRSAARDGRRQGPTPGITHPLALLVAAGSLLVMSDARAQDVPPPPDQLPPDAEADAEATEGADQEAAEPADAPDQDVAEPTAGDEVPELPEGMDEVYGVVPGDTLWDISARYLKNPWYWPKVWSFNPEITNPHLIYPGNKVRLTKPVEGMPSEVDVVGPEGEGAAGGTDDVVYVDVPGELSPDELVRVVGDAPMVYQVDRSAMLVRRETFVPVERLETAATIVGDPLNRILYAAPDRVFVQFKANDKAKVGDRYSIYRVTQKLEHPENEEHLGYVTVTMGSCRIVAVRGRMATVVVTEAYDPIQQGDILGPHRESVVSQIIPVENQKDIGARIVQAGRLDSVAIGDHQTVYLDAGEREGVRRGNQFVVKRGIDAVTAKRLDLEGEDVPYESIGTVLVVDTAERVSTGLVTWSLRELRVGDRVEMAMAAAPR
jgi:hypothetical protein